MYLTSPAYNNGDANGVLIFSKSCDDDPMIPRPTPH